MWLQWGAGREWKEEADSCGMTTRRTGKGKGNGKCKCKGNGICGGPVPKWLGWL